MAISWVIKHKVISHYVEGFGEKWVYMIENEVAFNILTHIGKVDIFSQASKIN